MSNDDKSSVRRIFAKICDNLRIEFTSNEQHLVIQEVLVEAGRCLILLGILGVWYQIDIGQILDIYQILDKYLRHSS